MMRIGRFAISCIGLWAICSIGAAQTNRGYGPWKLGMSKAEVAAVADYGPYREVRTTGGLETEKGFFDGRPCNVSFVFGEAGLRKIQIWVYEGKSIEEAIAGWYQVYDFFHRTYGEVESKALQLPPRVEKAEFLARVRAALATQARDAVLRVQMAPTPMPEGIAVFSSLFRDPKHGCFVFVYYQEP